MMNKNINLFVNVLLLLLLIGFIETMNPKCTPKVAKGSFKPTSFVFFMNFKAFPKFERTLLYFVKAIACEIPTSPDIQLSMLQENVGSLGLSAWSNTVDFLHELDDLSGSVLINSVEEYNTCETLKQHADSDSSVERLKGYENIQFIVPFDANDKECSIDEVWNGTKIKDKVSFVGIQIGGEDKIPDGPVVIHVPNIEDIDINEPIFEPSISDGLTYTYLSVKDALAGILVERTTVEPTSTTTIESSSTRDLTSTTSVPSTETSTETSEVISSSTTISTTAGTPKTSSPSPTTDSQTTSTSSGTTTEDEADTTVSSTAQPTSTGFVTTTEDEAETSVSSTTESTTTGSVTTTENEAETSVSSTSQPTSARTSSKDLSGFAALQAKNDENASWANMVLWIIIVIVIIWTALVCLCVIYICLKKRRRHRKRRNLSIRDPVRPRSTNSKNPLIEASVASASGGEFGNIIPGSKEPIPSSEKKASASMSYEPVEVSEMENGNLDEETRREKAKRGYQQKKGLVALKLE